MEKLRRYFFWLVTFNLFSFSAFGQDISTTHEDLNNFTYLVSYGGSGNTWLRYCLEFITKRPTLSLDRLKAAGGFPSQVSFPLKADSPVLYVPIDTHLKLGVDYSKEPIIKSHRFSVFSTVLDKNTKARYILLLRNPKECVVRNLGFKKALQSLKNPNFTYYSKLETFDKWSVDNRLIIYYENLIKNPRETLQLVLNFLHEKDDLLEIFMNDLEDHKQRVIQFYEFTNHTSHTKGANTNYHSEKLTIDQRIELDKAMKNAQPNLWKKYLIRFEEV